MKRRHEFAHFVFHRGKLTKDAHHRWNRRAKDSARAAVGYAPDNAAYRLILINVLLRDEQFAEAEGLAGEAAALLPESAVPLAMRAYARQRQGRWDDARTDLDRALQ